MKSVIKESLWKEEIKKDRKLAIEDRLFFHGGLSVQDIVECTGLCVNTVRKHLKNLVKENRAIRTPGVSYEHYRLTVSRYKEISERQ